MFKSLAHLSLLLLAAVLLASCASTRFTSAWRDREYTGPTLKKIVVIGISEETAARRVFEDSFAKALNQAGVDAVPGYTLIPVNPGRPVEDLREAVERIHADGVLVARALRAERRLDYTPGHVRVMPGIGYHSGFWGYYGSAIIDEPRLYSYSVITIETNLWPTSKDGKVLWSAISETTDPDNVQKAASELAKLVIKALAEQKLIETPPAK
ncbi:hypothetical protein [Niveibacterium terrae]|uniref:hypothetical protein n=1 Tax=Niveibacterium terrae TaxID=3373598 RepID=UPI003A9355F7